MALRTLALVLICLAGAGAAGPVRASEMAGYDIARLLQFDGPSTRREAPGEGWVAILDYRNSDANAHTVATLLSARGIPFHLDRPDRGWSQPRLRIYVSVPRARLAEAQAVLAAAAQHGVLERVEGTRGLPGFPTED